MELIREQHPDPTLCLTSITEEIGLSANYTGHIFKQYTQKSVASYLLEVRMGKIAYYLQNTNHSINKILELPKRLCSPGTAAGISAALRPLSYGNRYKNSYC